MFNDIFELYESEYYSDENTENELKGIIEEYFVLIIKQVPLIKDVQDSSLADVINNKK